MRLAVCRKCGKPITFAVVANNAGKPPSRMPLDPTPNPDGNVAVYKDATGSLVGRVVGKGGDHLGYERLMMPHFATCPEREAGAAKGQLPETRPEGVTFLAEFRKAKSAQAKAKRNRRGRRPPPQITGIRIPGRKP
jgi:hypothetical protein